MAQRDEQHDFARLLDYLKATRGFDFTGYKISTLLRRVQKRMSEVQVESYADYIDYLEVHPGEYQPLFNTVLINLTSFFRDRDAWDALAAAVLPKVIAERGNLGLRVWCAGCASGEEAYTIAILLAEAMGEESFRQRAKIYGTDADEEALAQARLGTYDERRFADVPPDLTERYFEAARGKRTFRPDLRRSLIFGRHDLVQDAAISRVDLLICRNVLMYFNLEAQSRMVARFHFALNPHGYLFLGKAETLLAHGDSFKPVDLKHRLFQRLPSSGLRERLLAFAPVAAGQPPPTGQMEHEARLREKTFESGTVAQLVIDRHGNLVLASDRARQMFNLPASDLGRPLQDLDISFRPVELRGPIETAYKNREVVRIPDVSWKWRSGEEIAVEVQILPLIGQRNDLLGVSVSYLDLTQAKRLEADLERMNQELVTALEELQSAKEELETTNEELQSTVEELETTNEELQSANEELETMNEELQSSNDELRTMNDQMLQRSEDLHQVNDFLASILGSLQAGVAVLDRALSVLLWSQRAEDLWGLRGEEAVERPFLKLDIGLPVAMLKQPLRACLDGSAREVVTLEGVNRRGRPIVCKVTCSTLGGHGDREGDLLVIMEDTTVA
jgi:two-component system CheB/CheR fusion protein